MLNRVVLMGRLVANPELRHTQNGLAVTSFTLAVDRNFVRPGEEKSTDFIDIVAWRNGAEFAAKYFSKGQLVAVDGTLQTRTYQDKNGVTRKAFEVIADKLHFAEKKRDSFTSSDEYSSSGFGSHGAAGGDNNSSLVTEGLGVSNNSDAVNSGNFKSSNLDFTELPTEDDDLPF